MQVPFDVSVSAGEEGVRRYLEASTAYLASVHHRRRMVFDFPDIRKNCPACTGVGCARWKGYYTRGMQDAGLSYFGAVVIRTGECRRFGIQFSMLPDFLLPYRKLTRPSVAALKEARRRTPKLQDAIDTLFPPWCERLYLPCSTAQDSLRAAKRLLCPHKIPYTAGGGSPYAFLNNQVQVSA